MDMPEKASEKLLPASLFVFAFEIPDLIGMVPPVFFPKSRLFGAPFISIDFPGTAGKILTACGRGALAPKKTGPAFSILFYSSS